MGICCSLMVTTTFWCQCAASRPEMGGAVARTSRGSPPTGTSGTREFDRAAGIAFAWMAFFRAALVDAITSRLVPGLLGLALIGLAAVLYGRVSPTVGGPFFGRHPKLKTFQRVVPPALIALVGLGVAVWALAH